jgi:FHA domain-containing protein
VAEETFRIVKGNAAGTQITVGTELLIGRSAQGEGRLGEDPEISRQHARVTRTPQGLQIEDLGSTNGTFVNGKRLTAPQQLNPGDTIEVGTTTLQLADAAGRAPQVTAVTAQPVPPPPPAAQPPQAPPPQAPPPAAGPPPPAPPPAGRPPAPPPPAAPPPAAPPPAARPPAPAPAGGPPGAPPAPAKKGAPVPLIAGLGLLLVAAIVIGVVVLGGGGDDDTKKTSSTADNLKTNRAAAIIINTRGPARDSQGNKIVTAGGGT